jgi:lipopolysaccharide biosynthesis glycosyltransferase
MENIVLVFAVKGAFAPHLAVTIQSIFETNPTEEFKMICLVADVPKQDLEKLKGMFEGRSSTLELVPVNVAQFIDLPVCLHLDLSSYFRLLIPYITTEKKALYLDSDLVIRGSLRRLWEIELGDRYIGVVPDFCGNFHPKLPHNAEIGYLNTGVMLMNLEQWRGNKISEKILDFSRNQTELIRWAEQCGINAICKDHILMISPEYNFQGIFYESSYKKPKPFSSQEMEVASKSPLIIHYLGTKKPWHWGCKHPDRGLYWQYLRRTPFKRYFPENPTPMNILRSIAPKGMINFFYKKKNVFKSIFRQAIR